MSSTQDVDDYPASCYATKYSSMLKTYLLLILTLILVGAGLPINTCFAVGESREDPKISHESAHPRRRLIKEAEKIWMEEDQVKQMVLRIDALPEQSSIAVGLSLGRDHFSQALLSPGEDLIAFSVEGFHGWSGLYDLNQKKVTEVAFFFEGRVTQLSFSPDACYLAIEAMGPGGFSSISLWDVGEAKSLRWSTPECPTGFPADVRLQEWVDNNLKIAVRCVDEEMWEESFLEIHQGKLRRRLDREPRRLR